MQCNAANTITSQIELLTFAFRRSVILYYFRAEETLKNHLDLASSSLLISISIKIISMVLRNYEWMEFNFLFKLSMAFHKDKYRKNTFGGCNNRKKYNEHLSANMYEMFQSAENLANYRAFLGN